MVDVVGQETSYTKFIQEMPQGEEATEYAIRYRLHSGFTGVRTLGTIRAEAIIRAAREWSLRAVNARLDNEKIIEMEFVSRPVHKWTATPDVWMAPTECLEKYHRHDFQQSESNLQPESWVFCTRCGEEPAT